MALELRLFPDPALRLLAQEVPEEGFGDELASFADRMAEAMAFYGGVGLAANQVGVVRRVIIVRPDEEAVAYALVNPRLVASSEETDLLEEGCLSLPGLRVPVERHLAIELVARTPLGEQVELELEGYAARVVQHEIDHLDGVLLHDRVRAESRNEVMRELRRLLPGWLRGPRASPGA